jgi:transcriptional regulator with XRE-family HTH domain
VGELWLPVFPGKPIEDYAELPEVVDLLRVLVSQEDSQASLAAEIGISPQYLNDILKGRRDPGETVLRYLGLQKRVIYVPLTGTQA